MHSMQLFFEKTLIPSSFFPLFNMAPVAQGIEQGFSKPLVAGSNPAGRTKSYVPPENMKFFINHCNFSVCLVLQIA